jgi:hypothetical protein
MCRLGRTAAELLRFAAQLDRTLARHQKLPVAFFGVVVQDEVDIPALETIWASRIPACAAVTATTPPPTAPQPATRLDPVDSRPDPQPAPRSEQKLDQPPATPRTRPAGADWMIEQLDQGPGWSREVLRPRTAADPVPEPAA